MPPFESAQGSNQEKKPIHIESFEALEKLGEGVNERIDSQVDSFISESDTQIDTGLRSLGGEDADVQEALTSVSDVREEAESLRESTKHKITEQSGGESESIVEEAEVSAAERGVQVSQMRDEYSDDQLIKLRKKTADDYGSGLVKSHHDQIMTGEYASHEKAQEAGYAALDEKIERGVVDPLSINSEMISILGVRDKEPVSVEFVEEIGSIVMVELKEFVDKGLIKPEEAVLILSEAEKFAGIYSEGYPDAYPDQVLEITRTNARKLAFQTERDKQVFSGSDHGTKHILEGNMTVADSMLDGLGDKVTAKDRVLIHQIMVDHDMGYTTGIAQAPGSFEASKDHPIFSAKLVEENKEYYVEMFGEDGYETILDVIKMHSYPTSDYDTPTDPQKGFNPEIIRSISSTADALGVTAETKAPAFFRQPEAIEVLQKVKLYGETNLKPKIDKKTGETTMVPIIEPEVLEQFKEQLREIAAQEPDQSRREGYINAIDNQFNPVTVEMTLGLYTGVMNNVSMQERNGKMVPHVKMDISRSQALIGDTFGDKLSIKAFVKAMEDFGVPPEAFGDMAKVIREIRNASTEEDRLELMKRLRYESDSAVFEFGSEFNDTDPAIAEKFEQFEKVSIRGEIGTMTRKLESLKEKTPESVGVILEDFVLDLGLQIDVDELGAIMEIQGELMNNIGDDTAFTNTLRKLTTFRTKKETEFMGVKLPDKSNE